MTDYPALPEPQTTKPRTSLLSRVLVVVMFLSLIFFLSSLGYWFFLQRFDYLPEPVEVVSYTREDLEITDFQIARPDLSKELESLELSRNIGIQRSNLDRGGEVNSFALNPVVDPNTYLAFSGEGFVNFYDQVEYEKVVQIGSEPDIRGDNQVDLVIRDIAEGRGYKLRPEAVAAELVAVDGERLQVEARDAWSTMKSAAARDGLDLRLVSGYRSVSDQREIFVNAISNLTDQSITSRQADEGLNQVLTTRSIPGYSKHHTGYTMDLSCGNTGLTRFGSTECYDWLSANNYLNAKRFGFIPSYPKGAENQGPDPEAWEYVWVGEEALRR
jgi:hypothetical protein